METMKMRSLFILLAGTLCLTGYCEEKTQVARHDDTIPVTEEFTSSAPDVVGIKYVPQGGEAGAGILQFEIRKKSDKAVEVTGPEVRLPEGLPSVTSRRIGLNIRMKLSDAPDDLLEIRFRQNDGRWARAVAPLSNWDTMIHPRAAREWAEWKNAAGAGVLNPEVRSGRIVFLFKPAAGHGRVEIERIALTDLQTQNHRFISRENDHSFNTDSAEMTIRYADPAELISGMVTVSDEENRKLDEIPVVPGTTETVCQMKDRGFYQFTVDARYKDGRNIRSSCSAAVLGPNLGEEIRRTSRFGLCRVWASADFVKKIGSNIDYGSWHLNGVRPDASGELRFDGNSGSIWGPESTWHAAMFSPLPKFLLKEADRSKSGLLPPESWDKLAEAVRIWTRNTNPLPDVIDIFNEPDAHWRGSEQDLVKFHNVIAAAIKQERPEAKVGGPCFYGIRMKDFERFVNKGILKGMDYVTMHAYVNKSAPEGEFIENIIAMQEFLATTPYRNLPVAFTEYGWTSTYYSWQYPVNELTKAQYCARSAILCTVRDIRHIAYFCGKWYGDDERPRYSIINADSTPLPAAAAYAALIRELAEIKDGGVWLKLDPECHAALFSRGTQTVGAFWTTDKNERELVLPENPEYVRSMTGRKLAPERKQRLSPSPLYAAFSDPELARVKRSAARSCLPGTRVEIGGEEFIHSPLLNRRENGAFEFPETISLGTYTILSRSGKTWTAYPIEIVQPLPVKFSGIDRNGKNGSDLRFALSSKFPEKVNALAELRLDDGQTDRKEVILEPGKNTVMAFPLKKSLNGKRHTGELKVSVSAPIRWMVRCPIDSTRLSIPFFSREPEQPPWDSLAAVGMNAFYRQGDFDEKERSRTPAQFKAYATPSAFHLQVTARDPNHDRSAHWGEMWKADSLQFAFDLDAAEPWRPNDVGNGFNGHRVVVYGAARHWKNLPYPEVWCWMNHAEGVRSGLVDEITKQSSVVRDDKRKETVYTLRIPWKFLGTSSAPPPGQPIGFSLLLNDGNGNGGRTKVNYFNGIDTQDPTLYGKFQLFEPPFPEKKR